MRLIGLAVVLTVGLVLAPLAAVAQQAGKVYRIGVLSSGSSIFDDVGRGSQAFLERLSDLGWVVGQNLTPASRIARLQSFHCFCEVIPPPGLTCSLRVTPPDSKIRPLFMQPTVLGARLREPGTLVRHRRSSYSSGRFAESSAMPVVRVPSSPPFTASPTVFESAKTPDTPRGAFGRARR